MSSVVQFIHPGSEPSIDQATKWNVFNSHKRKFIRVSGKTTSGAREVSDVNINIWAEWEGVSTLVEKYTNPQNTELPRYLFAPMVSGEPPVGAMNIDPYVFGDNFLYCICKQGHYPSLRNLNPSDIILFGSNKNGRFVLDTLFVVKNSVLYKPWNKTSTSQLDYSETYLNVGLRPIGSVGKSSDCVPCGCSKNRGCSNKTCLRKIDDYRLYSGVNFEESSEFDGLFSFVPSLINEPFSRPAIEGSYISDNLKQGIKITQNVDPKTVWKDVKEQVLKNGLLLMTYAKEP